MSARPRSQFARLACCMSLVLLAAAAGCARERASESSPHDRPSVASRLLGTDATAVTPSGLGTLQRRRGSFYPLAVGNVWEYEVRERITVIPYEGPVAIGESVRPWYAEITGTRHIGRRDYFLQAEYDPRALALTVPAFAMRQDRSGLYNLDLVSADAAAAGRAGADPVALRASLESALASSPRREPLQRAALQVSERLAALHAAARGSYPPGSGGADSGEITMLRYPLFAGAHWVVRHEPRFARRVIGVERLELPAGTITAWKIRGLSELYGPDDEVHFWYASAGLVRILLRTQSQATDVGGGPIGVMIGEWDQVLMQARLADPGGPHKLTATDAEHAGR